MLSASLPACTAMTIRLLASALAVAAALMALAWLGNEPPERRRAN